MKRCAASPWASALSSFFCRKMKTRTEEEEVKKKRNI